MKKNLLLSLSLFVAGSTLVPQSTRALTYQQIENIKVVSTLATLAGVVGYVFYKDITNPNQPQNVTRSTSVNMSGPHWMSMQPCYRQGAVNFQKATAFPFQGAFNL